MPSICLPEKVWASPILQAAVRALPGRMLRFQPHSTARNHPFGSWWGHVARVGWVQGWAWHMVAVWSWLHRGGLWAELVLWWGPRGAALRLEEVSWEGSLPPGPSGKQKEKFKCPGNGSSQPFNEMDWNKRVDWIPDAQIRLVYFHLHKHTEGYQRAIILLLLSHQT